MSVYAVGDELCLPDMLDDWGRFLIVVASSEEEAREKVMEEYEWKPIDFGCIINLSEISDSGVIFSISRTLWNENDD